MSEGREFDALVAEKVMGLALDWYHQHQVDCLNEGDHRTMNSGRGIYMRCMGCDRHGYGNEVDWRQRCPTPECPAYTTDPAAACQVEDEIARRGLQDRYIAALLGLTDWQAHTWLAERATLADLWALIRATPEQRCRAALQAMGVEL